MNNHFLIVLIKMIFLLINNFKRKSKILRPSKQINKWTNTSQRILNYLVKTQKK